MKSIDVGSRLELFLDDYIVESLEGDAAFQLHKPQSHEVVLSNDMPWESSTAYFAVFRDEKLFRMYYRGFHHGTGEQALGEPMCYAESRDGINWNKPELGLFSFKGSSKNNIVLGGNSEMTPATENWHGDIGADIRWRGDFVPFKDDRPGVNADARYKTLIRGCRGLPQILGSFSDYGMYPFKSPDGIHWTLMSQKPVITKGRFDSQNLAFWDAGHGHYVAFVRDCRWGRDRKDAPADVPDFEQVPEGVWRDVRMCVSKDFLNWSDPEFVKYPGEPLMELYTNAVIPYERAPHILIGFPTRFITETEQTEPILMTSRDGGRTFKRWMEPLIPRDAPLERDGNRSNYMAHGMVRGNEREYFLYATEGHCDEPFCRRLRRFSCRVDGFVSIRSGAGGGRIVTKPLIFAGSQLIVNYSAACGGSLRVELQDIDGNLLASSLELSGDSIEQPVTWKVSDILAGTESKPVKLCFVLQNADLYSFQFADMPEN